MILPRGSALGFARIPGPCSGHLNAGISFKYSASKHPAPGPAGVFRRPLRARRGPPKSGNGRPGGAGNPRKKPVLNVFSGSLPAPHLPLPRPCRALRWSDIAISDLQAGEPDGFSNVNAPTRAAFSRLCRMRPFPAMQITWPNIRPAAEPPNGKTWPRPRANSEHESTSDYGVSPKSPTGAVAAEKRKHPPSGGAIIGAKRSDLSTV